MRDRRPGSNQTWTIVPGVNGLGRDPANQIHILDDSVSRRHSEILFQDDQLEIRDLGSRNGTLLNGVPVGASLQPLQSGDRLQLGTLELEVVSEPKEDSDSSERRAEGRRSGDKTNHRQGMRTDHDKHTDQHTSMRTDDSRTDEHTDMRTDHPRTDQRTGMRTDDSEADKRTDKRTDMRTEDMRLEEVRAEGKSAAERSVQQKRSEAAATPEWLTSTETRLGWGDIQRHLDEHAREIMKLYRVLLDAGRLLVVPEGMGDLFQTTIELASRVAPAERILVYLLEADTLSLQASRGLPEAAAPESLMSRTILRTVLEDQSALLVRDPLSDPRFQASESIRLMRTRSSMTVPLFDNERVIGLLHLDTTNPLDRYDEDQLRALALLGNLIAIKVTNAQLLDELRVKARMEQEMETAAHIQRRLLPERLPEVDGYEIAAHFEPALRTAGDFYDARRRPDGRVELLIGDVAGKGVGAALLMSHTVSAYRVLSAEGHALHDLVTRLNEHVFASSDPTRFATLFAGWLDPLSHRLEYVNAGHCPPLLLSADGTWERLDATGAAVGLMDGMTFSRGEIEIPPGSILCLYTDGVIEAEMLPEDTAAAGPGAMGSEIEAPARGSEIDEPVRGTEIEAPKIGGDLEGPAIQGELEDAAIGRDREEPVVSRPGDDLPRMVSAPPKVTVATPEDSGESLEFFGEAGLRSALQGSNANAAEAVTSILERVHAFAGTLQDDCTVVVLYRAD